MHRDHVVRHAPSTLVAALVAALVACGSSKGGADNTGPIEECQAYETAMAKCSGAHTPFATQPAAMPSTHAARDEMRSLCAINLRRVQATCR